MSWAMAVGAGVSLAGNMLGNRSAKKAAQAQAAADEARRRTLGLGTMQAQQQLAGQLQSIAPQMSAAYAPKYANVNTGFATTAIDPTTGTATSSLNAPWAAQRDMFMNNAQTVSGLAPGLFSQGQNYLNQGQDMFSRAAAFNPDTAAANRYAAAQAILQPGDTLNEQNLMQQLYDKGGYGLTLNTPAAGGGTVGVNPYASTFLNARNQRNAQMSYDALREGQGLVDSMFNRGATLNAQGGNLFNLGGNMFNLAGSQSSNAANLEGMNQNALNQAGNWSNQFNAGNVQQQNAYWKPYMQGLQLNTDAFTNALNTMYGGATPDAGAGANNRSQMFSGIGNALGGVINKVDFNRMFNPAPVGGAAGGGMPAGSAYNLTPGDLGMFGN